MHFFQPHVVAAGVLSLLALACTAAAPGARVEAADSWRHINNKPTAVDQPPPLLSFHDPRTNQTLRAPIVMALPPHCNHPNHPHPNGLQPIAHRQQAACNGWWPPADQHAQAPLRQSTGFGLPCSCAMLNCGCCVGANGSRPRFDRQCKCQDSLPFIWHISLRTTVLILITNII